MPVRVSFRPHLRPPDEQPRWARRQTSAHNPLFELAPTYHSDFCPSDLIQEPQVHRFVFVTERECDPGFGRGVRCSSI